MFEVPAQKWVDLTDDSGLFGLSLLNDCKYGHDVRGNLLRITLLRSPKSPDPNADMGEHEFTYSLYPHQGNWQEAETHRRACELNYPLHVVMTEEHPGALGREGSFVRLEAGAGVILSAVKRAEQDEKMVLRLYELFGKKTPAKLHFARKVVAAEETDLLERPLAALPVSGHTVIAELSPFEIKTVLVELGRAHSGRR